MHYTLLPYAITLKSLKTDYTRCLTLHRYTAPYAYMHTPIHIHHAARAARAAPYAYSYCRRT
jgi:hypothetical protein